ncbi:MAG UNVERIFIED_CONTAM: hypothetical protein LVR18_24885 [Planctomycetaceae bacterium]
MKRGRGGGEGACHPENTTLCAIKINSDELGLESPSYRIALSWFIRGESLPQAESATEVVNRRTRLDRRHNFQIGLPMLKTTTVQDQCAASQVARGFHVGCHVGRIERGCSRRYCQSRSGGQSYLFKWHQLPTGSSGILQQTCRQFAHRS